MNGHGATIHFIQRLQERYGISIDRQRWRAISDEIREGKHHFLVSTRDETDWYLVLIGSQTIYAAYRRGTGLITTLTQRQFCNTHGFPCHRTYQLPEERRKRSLGDILETTPVPEGWRVDGGYAYRKQPQCATRH